jgi:cytochrome c553
MKSKGRLSAMVLGSALVCTWTVGAQEDVVPPERLKLIALVEQVTQDEVRHDAAIRAGRERIVLCSQCHGEDGNAKMPGVPNLAGQNPAYLVEQVEKFADGRRKNFVMQSLSRSFTIEDKVNISVYFASLRPKRFAVDSKLAKEGARIYESACNMCHGADGRGAAGYANVSGQQQDYAIATLKRFRENSKQAVSAEDMKRHNTRMEQVTQNLSDRDIESLAAYMALPR